MYSTGSCALLINGKRVLCCGKFKFRKREMVSSSLAGGNVMEITNFVKFVRQILGGTTLFKHLNIKTALKNVTQTLKGN